MEKLLDSLKIKEKLLIKDQAIEENMIHFFSTEREYEHGNRPLRRLTCVFDSIAEINPITYK